MQEISRGGSYLPINTATGKLAVGKQQGFAPLLGPGQLSCEEGWLTFVYLPEEVRRHAPFCAKLPMMLPLLHSL